MKLELKARAVPLEPCAVVAEGEVALRLAQRLGREVGAPLRVVTSSTLLVALGPAEALPWVDGVRYLGAEAGCPSLLLPTTWETSVPVLLADRALRRTNQLPDGPLALLSLTRVVPLVSAAPLTHALLERFLRRSVA